MATTKPKKLSARDKHILQIIKLTEGPVSLSWIEHETDKYTRFQILDSWVNLQQAGLIKDRTLKPESK